MSKSLKELSARFAELKHKITDLNRELKAVTQEKEEYENRLIGAMEAVGFDSVRTKDMSISIQKASVPTVVDWDEVYKYIIENNACHILQRRPSTSVCRELFEMGENIPGMEEFEKVTLLTKSR